MQESRMALSDVNTLRLDPSPYTSLTVSKAWRVFERGDSDSIAFRRVARLSGVSLRPFPIPIHAQRQVIPLVSHASLADLYLTSELLRARGVIRIAALPTALVRVDSGSHREDDVYTGFSDYAPKRRKVKRQCLDQGRDSQKSRRRKRPELTRDIIDLTHL